MSEPGDILLRPAADADIPALGHLGALLVALHHDFDPDRFFPTTPRTEGSYAGYLDGERRRKGVVLLVAEAAGEVAGYVYAGLEGRDYMVLRGPAGVVYDLVVAPERRGRGIGRRLLEAAIAELGARGAPRVLLSTAARNEPAQRLFESLGFRRTMIEMTREAD